MVFFLTGCSSKQALKLYTPQQAIANGDVVDVHGQVTNLEKLENFMIAVDKGTASKLKITTYTTEGDPIIKVLDYDGKTITMSTDNSLDKFAGPIKGITYSSYTKITKDDTQSPPSYYLVDSSGRQLLLTATKILPPMPMDDITADQPGYISKYPKLDITSGSIKINWVRSTANYTSKPDVLIGNSNFGVEMDDALSLPAHVVMMGSRIDFKAADVPGLDKPSYKVQLVGKNKELIGYPVDNSSIYVPKEDGEFLFQLEVNWGYNGNHQIFYWFKISTITNQIGLRINGLPTGWDINLNGDKDGQILKKGKVVGQIEMIGYYGNNSSLPNHSSIVQTEDITSGLGKGKMYILDRDTPAASAEQRRWTEIYVVLPISNSNLAFGISIDTDESSLNGDMTAMKNIVQELALK
ncbi:DUF4362 domain-containing protein [Desulfitobacterium sp.]|uniref:DUF4362 domain-containing protein n=1 Tax=Desulfitobacterium sp. TaxID=49981 RepID=UPI002BBE95A8|nr:DUF4362 domain-containing protein [Desulfitobacterium sp.]HVJ49092.1 DUF4362 domain-containing protein [Desulfitobacterium sp.]